MNDLLIQHKSNFENVLEHLKKEIANFRVGRASPSLVENITVVAYGTPTPLVHLASIGVTDPKTIAIQPWDKSLMKDLEKALQQADLGSSPLVKDDNIIISIPSLTEETRKDMIKKLNQKLEETKVSLRNNREKLKEMIINQEKNKEISEDDKFRILEDLDEMVKFYNEQVKQIGGKKEQEIMTI